MKYSIIWGLVFLLSIVSASAVLDDAIGAYTMDDADISGTYDYLDATGGGDTIIATGTPTTGQTGILDEAVDYSGSGQYHTCTGCHSVAGSDYTLIAWVNFDTTTGQMGVITKFGATSTTSEYIMQMFNGQIWCSYGDSTSAQHTTGLTAGNWSMVSCRFDQSNGNLTACVNTACTSTTDASINSGTSGNFQISGRNGASTLLNGKVDMSYVYSRKLSDSEIYDQFNSGAGLNAYVSAPASPFFQVTAKDLDTASSLQNISVILENGTVYTNASSTFVATNINDSGLYNFTVSVDNYFNVSFTNYNTSADLQANMTEFPTVSVHNLWDNVSLTEFNFTLVNYTCEQPTTNESGCIFTDNGGNYSVSGSSSKTYTIIYKKPDSAVGGIWDVKHGTGNRYNVTIPSSCWNYNDTYLFLRVGTTLIQQTGATWTSSSAVYCQSGTFTYTNIGTTETASGQYNSVTQTGSDLWFDDDYSTGALDTCSQSWASGDTDLCQTARFYEETMYWSLNKTYTSTTVEQYVPLNESVNIIFQTHNYFNSTVTHDFTNSNDLNQSLFQSQIMFNATQIITGNGVTPANFTIDGVTKGVGEPFYLSVGSHTVTFSKTGYNNKDQIISVSAFDNTTLTITDVGSDILGIKPYTFFGNNSITTFTATINNTNYGYTHQINSTSGFAGFTIATGIPFTVTIDASGYALYTETFTPSTTRNESIYLFTTNSLYISFYNADNLSLINYDTITLDIISDVYGTNRTTSNGTIYVDVLTPTNYSLRYSGTMFAENTYYVSVDNRSNTTLTLYLEPIGSTQNVTINVIDQNTNDLENAVVKVLKYFPALGTYTLVGIATTNFDGNAFVNLEIGTEYYKFIVEYPYGTVRKTTSPTYIYSTSLTIQLQLTDPIAQNFFRLNDISYELVYNNASDSFRYTYTDSANTVASSCLYTYKKTTFDYQLYNTTCNTGASGTILSPVVVQNGTTYLVKAYVTYSDGGSIQVAQLIKSFSASTIEGRQGLFIVLVLTLLFALLGTYNLSVASILTPMPILISSLTGIINFNWGVAVALQLLGVIIAFIATRR